MVTYRNSSCGLLAAKIKLRPSCVRFSSVFASSPGKRASPGKWTARALIHCSRNNSLFRSVNCKSRRQANIHRHCLNEQGLIIYNLYQSCMSPFRENITRFWDLWFHRIGGVQEMAWAAELCVRPSSSCFVSLFRSIFITRGNPTGTIRYSLARANTILNTYFKKTFTTVLY